MFFFVIFFVAFVILVVAGLRDSLHAAQRMQRDSFTQNLHM
jgi:hypothetical protein